MTLDPRTMGYKATERHALSNGFASMTFAAKNGTRTYALYLHDRVQLASRDAATVDAAYGLMLTGKSADEAMRHVLGR